MSAEAAWATLFMVHLPHSPSQGGVIHILPYPGRLRHLPALLLKHLARFLPLSPLARIVQDQGQKVGSGHCPELCTSGRHKGSLHSLCAPSLHSGWLCMWSVVPDQDKLSSLTFRGPCSAPAQGGYVW